MSGRTEGCDGEKNVPVVERVVIMEGADPAAHALPEKENTVPRNQDECMPESKSACGPEVAKATRMSVAMSEIAAGVELLKRQGVSPESALNTTKEVWDKVTNHDVVAMASFALDGGNAPIPTASYRVGGVPMRKWPPGAEAERKRKFVREVRNDPHGLMGAALGGEFAKADPTGEKMAGAGRVPSADEKKMIMSALRSGGVTAAELDGLSYELRQIERYVTATEAEVFGRMFREENWHPASDLTKLLAEGWKVDPDAPTGDGCGGIPPYGWMFDFHVGVAHRLVHPDRPDYKFIEGGPKAVVHFQGRLFTDTDPTESRTYRKHGREEWERRIFHGLKAFAGDQEFFRNLIKDNGLGRVRRHEAMYEFARILVELRLMKQANREEYMPNDLCVAMASDPLGSVVQQVFQGPFSNG